MREFHIDGRVYRAYEPDEIASTVSASPSSRRNMALEQAIRLMGSNEDFGPLMLACRRAAEYIHCGGHSPATRVNALKFHP